MKNPGTSKHRRWTDRVNLSRSLADAVKQRAIEGSTVTEQPCLDQLMFGEILEVTQTFDPSEIRYFRAAEFNQVIKPCALHRLEVCFAPDRDHTLTWCVAFLERIGAWSSLLFSATYAHRPLGPARRSKCNDQHCR